MTTRRMLMPVSKMLLLPLLLLAMLPDGAKGHTTCTAVTTIYNTSVTCLFARNIASDSFNVQFFFPNTSVQPEMPLVCNKLLSGRLTCQKQKDVYFDEKQKISDRFTFTRPSSLDKLAGGHYQCQIVPSTGAEVNRHCSLTYQEVPGHVPLAMLSTPELPTEKDGGDGGQNFSVITGVIFLILIVIIIVIVILLYRKRKSVTQWLINHTDGGLQPGAENNPYSPHATRIPDGLPTFFYNLGYKEATMEEKNAKEDEKNTKPPQTKGLLSRLFSRELDIEDSVKEDAESHCLLIHTSPAADSRPPTVTQSLLPAVSYRRPPRPDDKDLHTENVDPQRGRPTSPPVEAAVDAMMEDAGPGHPVTHPSHTASQPRDPRPRRDSRRQQTDGSRRIPGSAVMRDDTRAGQPGAHPSHSASPPGGYMGGGASSASSPEKDIYHDASEGEEDLSSPMMRGQQGRPDMTEKGGARVESSKEKKAREKTEKKKKEQAEKDKKEAEKKATKEEEKAKKKAK